MFEEVLVFVVGAFTLTKARRTNFGYFREWAHVASAKTGDNAERKKKRKKNTAEFFIVLSTLRLKIGQTECKTRKRDNLPIGEF